ncbi:winged helix-turn-helix domain-containing protein [Phragmitibacter flavus]|nr:winged helix-turn-helix domain-containing protein [Phragmitibacter flavus]
MSLKQTTMLHCFQFIEIDEPKRELRVHGKPQPLQPRIFDLLVHLVRHRDRVVPKDELLDAVWTDVMVADGALQRAISLLRSTFQQAGADDVIRTFPRHGYRFCFDPAADDVIPPKPDPNSNQLLALNDHSLQQWAQKVQTGGRDETLIAPLEEAFAQLIDQGERRRAAWTATLLAHIRMEWRDAALSKGWYHKARRLLVDQPPGREQGYLDYLGHRFAIAENDLNTALALAESTRAIGEHLHDADLETLGLVSIGEIHLFLNRIPSAMAALEEAGAAVSARILSPWAGGIIYCALIYTCMTRSDWRRASEWTDQFTRWGDHLGPISYNGLCRLHRAELLTIQGKLEEAEQEIRTCIEILAKHSPWVEGEVWRCLGETLLAKGDLAGAQHAFTTTMELGWDAQLELAQLKLAEGQPKEALKRLSRAFAENSYSCNSRRGRALSHWIVIAARAGDLDLARKTLAEIDASPDTISTPALKALVEGARAELTAAEGRTAAAIAGFRNTVRLWLDMGAPIPAAQTRQRLGELLAADGAAELAHIEFAAAEKAFREAGVLIAS